jgi:hypothetical protein
MWVSATTAWHVLRLWMEKTASRYGTYYCETGHMAKTVVGHINIQWVLNMLKHYFIILELKETKT